MTDAQYLTGKLLLAMPRMCDMCFERAVIFICAHDKNGAMGLVINHIQKDIEFNQLLEQLNIISNIEISINPLISNIPVMYGGPVAPARGFLLHSNEFKHNDTIRINDMFGVTGTIDALKNVVAGKGPQKKLFILGYAGWEAKQLDQEIKQNMWLVIEPDDEIVFGDNPDIKWLQAIQKLGFDPSMLSGDVGQA